MMPSTHIYNIYRQCSIVIGILIINLYKENLGLIIIILERKKKKRDRVKMTLYRLYT